MTERAMDLTDAALRDRAGAIAAIFGDPVSLGVNIARTEVRPEGQGFRAGEVL